MHISCLVFTLYCIVSTENTSKVEWVRSAHGGSFKVWRNWPNSKLICYSERGEPRLSFEYKFVGHLWKLQKLYPTVHAYLFFLTLYCIVSTEQVEWVRSAHGGSLRYEGIGRIQNWYVILKGENLGFHLNINLSATFENFKNYTQPYMHICFS